MLPAEQDFPGRFSRALVPDYMVNSSWASYKSLVEPKAKPTLEDVLTPECDIIVHPGFWGYSPQHNSEEPQRKPEYNEYLKHLRAYAAETFSAHKSLIVLTPLNKRRAALEAIALPDSTNRVILVPTMKGDTKLMTNMLTIPYSHTFWERLAKHVTSARTYGEYGEGCLYNVQEQLDQYDIPYSAIEEAIFYKLPSNAPPSTPHRARF